MDELPEGVPPYIQINQNEFCCLKQKKLKEEDISICECKFDVNDAETACGERCLNVLTNTECTPEYCPCGSHCRNQKFQKCEYFKTKLFKTDGRGWGLLADENIKAGQYIIEYCGEVISSEEELRSTLHETRFHQSCTTTQRRGSGLVLRQLDIEVYKTSVWVLNWSMIITLNGMVVLPSAVYVVQKTVPFSLGQSLKDYYHLWEDGDERYTVDEIPLYDSAEDAPFSEILKAATSFSIPEYSSVGELGFSVAMDDGKGSEHNFETHTVTGTSFSVPIGGVSDQTVTTEASEKISSSFTKDAQKDFSHVNSAISDIPSVSTSQDANGTEPGLKKKSQNQVLRKKRKLASKKQLDTKDVAGLFASREAREEISAYEEIKTKATSELKSLYDEIRPAIEEHERDNQDSVPTSVAEKWIGATCLKLKAEFDFHFSVIKNVMCPRARNAEEKLFVHDNPNELKYLTN
ncbi:hypothetical protein Leryth_001804 [Lithospermum erythrorhizon]|nr:hypothetical protein Leryth_001804 [Lithospermum erythrorhizon]